jgi:hypothetical protein
MANIPYPALVREETQVKAWAQFTNVDEGLTFNFGQKPFALKAAGSGTQWITIRPDMGLTASHSSITVDNLTATLKNSQALYNYNKKLVVTSSGPLVCCSFLLDVPVLS